MTDKETIAQLKQALKVAADALNIASDWNVDQVQVNPPLEWDLDGGDEDPADGWCSTRDLARKLEALSK